MIRPVVPAAETSTSGIETGVVDRVPVRALPRKETAAVRPRLRPTGRGGSTLAERSSVAACVASNRRTTTCREVTLESLGSLGVGEAIPAQRVESIPRRILGRRSYLFCRRLPRLRCGGGDLQHRIAPGTAEPVEVVESKGRMWRREWDSSAFALRASAGSHLVSEPSRRSSR